MAVAAHAFIAGFWVVAPITLHPTARLGDDVLLARLKRFSVIAMAAIPLLLFLGVWLAFVLAGGVAPLGQRPARHQGSPAKGSRPWRSR